MTVSRITLEYTTINYDRTNKTHQAFIKQEINEFNSAYNELCNYNKRTGLVSGLIGAAWMMGSITMWSSLLISISNVALSYQCFGRPEYAKQYQDQLSKLLELYKWCANSLGKKNVAEDKIFLELTETIAPLVEYNELKKPFTNFNGLPDDFCKIILLNPLHKDKFTYERSQAAKEWKWSDYLPGNKTDDTLVKSQPEETSPASDIYYNMQSRARFNFYSHQTGKNKSIMESFKEIAEPLAALSAYKPK